MDTAAADALGKVVAHAFIAALGVVVAWVFFHQPAESADIAAYRRALAASPAGAAAEVEKIDDPVVRDAAVLALVSQGPVAGNTSEALALCRHSSEAARPKCERAANSPHLRR